MFTESELINEMGGLRKFAMRLTGNASDADDLVQMTLLRAMEKKDFFEAGTSLFKWSSKIMFNLFVSAYRRKKKFETQYDPEVYLNTATMEPCQETETDLHTVRDAMNRLSAEHREILNMVCVKGLQYGEVADYLHIPVGTVRSRLSRARYHLQSLLDGAEGAMGDIVFKNDNAGMLETIVA